MILHEMLTGARLFQGSTLSEVVLKIVSFEPAGSDFGLPADCAHLRPYLARLLAPD